MLFLVVVVLSLLSPPVVSDSSGPEFKQPCPPRVTCWGKKELFGVDVDIVPPSLLIIVSAVLPQ